MDGIVHSLECVNPTQSSVHKSVNLRPISDGSSSQFWPIVCLIANVRGLKTQPFKIGLFYVHTKPTDNDQILSYYVSELKEMMADGLFISGKHFTVAQVSFICDALAVASIIEIMEHDSFVCCRRCYVVGKRAWSAAELWKMRNNTRYLPYP